MRKIKAISICIILTLLFGLIVPVVSATTSNSSYSDWEAAMNSALDWIRSETVPNPRVGSVGGEWAIIALARGGRIDADDPWLRGWFADLDSLLAEIDRLNAQGHDIHNPPSVSTFPAELRRWTDFQRVTLALGSLGIDASDYRGRNLTEIYKSFVPNAQRHALNQTVNVDTFALIALDSGNYDGDRDEFIQSMLDAQRADGTWSLNPALPSSAFDLDITAMALQAIAPYYYRGDPRVTDAVNRALNWLRGQTFADTESTAQMIVALTALGPEFADEAEYYVNRLLNWFDPTVGGFRRDSLTESVNHMATEQAAYALVAYWRFVNGMSALYDMSDVIGRSGDLTTKEIIGLYGKHADVRKIEVIFYGRTFDDIQTHANQQAIEALAARGIINGRSETYFAPSDTMTRAEFAAIITRGLGLPERNAAVFDDVASDAWFADAVGTAFYYEIVNGVSATLFNTNGTITRQEAAVMVARAARLTGLDTTLSDTEILNILAQFGDSRTVSDWAREALAFCYREKILDDYEFYIQPSASILRGEIAQMLYNLLYRANLL